MKNNIFKSIRFKLFVTLALCILLIVGFFVVINSVVLETLYYRSKKNASLNTYNYINENVGTTIDSQNDEELLLNLEKIEVENTFEIVITNQDGGDIYSTHGNFMSEFGNVPNIDYEINYSIFNKEDILLANEKMSLRKIKSKKNGMQYVLLIAKLDNGNMLYMRMPVTPLEINASISNKFILIIGVCALFLGGGGIIFITNVFTKPIEELNAIANEMSQLNFKRKYRIHDTGDEIDELGKSINTLSDKLEENINQLKKNNSEMEREIEEKSKIDEMRKRFISDVSHELKTPIALIQGYAEGLADNVITDEENKKFYAEVILDEANKMDKLVKSLLELMKLEYDERKLQDREFNLTELITNVIKNSKMKTDELKINVEFTEENKEFLVYADDFYIDQVVTNYYTNAIKNAEEKNKEKKIKISIKPVKNEDKYKVTVFNTGNNISQENLTRIWNRFYKIDESRDRSKGGSGIGLSLVRAIMTKYNNKYGVVNKNNGVEFYFEINKAK